MIMKYRLPDGFELTDPTRSIECPTCTQSVYVRSIALSKAHIKALRCMYELGGRITANDMANLGRSVYCNYSQLKYWGLIESNADACHKLTLSGVEFIEGKLALPRKLYVFNDLVRDVPLPDGGVAYIHEIKDGGIKSRQEARENLNPTEYTG